MDIHLAQPLQAVQGLFKAAGCPTNSAGFDIATHFEEVLGSKLGQQVPVLTAETCDRLPNQSLVRFYGMVQDMPNPEYYYGAVKQAGEVITTKYSDCFTLEPDADSDNHVWERRPLLCVPIPGLSAWTVPATLAIASQASVTGSPAGAVHGTTGVSNGDGGAPSQQAAAKAKRERAEGGAGEVDAQDTPMSDQDVSVTVTEGHAPGTDVVNGAPGSMPAQPSAKRTHVHEHTHTAACGTSGTCSMAAGDGTHRLTGGCLVYTYDNANSGIMLHDIVEVVGVLSHAPQLAAMHWGNGSNDKHGEQDAAVGCGGGADMDAEMAGLGDLGDEELGKASMLAASPPSSSMMRLHALLVHKVSSSALLPMTAAASAAGGRAATADASSVSTRAASAEMQVADAAGAPAAPVASNALGDIPRLRAQAVRVLAACLGDDELAAEYLLLQLLARVTIRVEQQAVGTIVLNLSRCPDSSTATSSTSSTGIFGMAPASAFAQSLQSVVGSLLPLCVALPLDVPALNHLSWAPVRDYDRERTSASPLVVAPGTVLLLDESGLAPGQLGQQGTASLQALVGVLRDQVLRYDLQFHGLPVPVDTPAVLLTVGRSVLRDLATSTVTVPLMPNQALPSSPADLAVVQAAVHSQGTTAGALDLSAVRAFLAAARALDWSVSEEAMGWLQQHFVDARRSAQECGRNNAAEEEGMQNKDGTISGGAGAVAAGGTAAAGAAGGGGGDEGMSAEAFSMLLTLSQLLCRSWGEAELSADRWQVLLALEQRRQGRLQAVL